MQQPSIMHPLLVKYFAKMKRDRWIAFLVVSLILLVISGLVIYFNIVNIINAIQGPGELTLENVDEIHLLSDKFDIGDKTYFQVDYNSEKYYADYLLTDWEWGTEYEDSGNYVPDFIFAYFLYKDLETEYVYIFPARIKHKDAERIYTEGVDSLIVTVNKFPEEERDFITSVNDILDSESKNYFEEEGGEGFETMYNWVVEYHDSGLINYGVVFDIEFNKPTGTLFWVAVMLAVFFVILAIMFIWVLKLQLTPLRKYLQKKINENDLRLISKELNQVVEEYKYKFGKGHIFLTESFVFYASNMDIIPIQKIKSANTINYSSSSQGGLIGILISKLIARKTRYSFNTILEIGYEAPGGKTKKAKLLIPKLDDIEEIRKYIYSKRGDIKQKVNSFWGKKRKDEKNK
ncbi:hypothetical protein GF362_06960 [Candidatus Dojkabacteria bacterium]|nr:hypothetical protein [Candidatus Dojkabacteria bacterium]